LGGGKSFKLSVQGMRIEHESSMRWPELYSLI
jgi:hypothetical protein